VDISYQQLKKTIYISMSVLGAVFLLGGFIFDQLRSSSPEPISMDIAATVLALVGTLCLCFGCATYLLRDDPDIWR
jgi:hypothetical protein